MNFSFKKILIIFLAVNLYMLGLEGYNVEFQGINNPETLTLLKSISHTVELEESPPATNTGLKRRAESDIPNLIKALHSLSYFNAKVEVEIHLEKQPPTVIFKVDTGPIYPLASFEIKPSPALGPGPFPFQEINLQDLGISIGNPALPQTIVEGEELLILKMEKNGYPLAKIENREVIADQATHSIHVTLYINPGPLCYFGEITYKGHQRVASQFFNKKISWGVGDIYDPQKIERTQNALETSGLFSSIAITHGENVSDEGLVPIEIEIVESKHRSVGAGIGYSTDDGFGVLAEWEHRNICGCGEKLSFKTLVAQRLQEGTLAYVIPDFRCPKQDLIWLADVMHQTTKGYHASSYSFSGIIEKQMNDRTRLSYGGMYKCLRDTHSDNNGSFNLVKAPFQIRWNNTNNLLDPTQGRSLNVKIIPSVQIFKPQFAYCINTITGSIYIPLRADKRLILAGKATLGAIFGEKRHTIPPSERFYAGNENLLRGYHYMTVSPLRHHEPIGGRSMMIYSLEARLRATETFGWVLFYDFGNVYENYLPQFDKKILQSVGVGLRYNTPVGPLRLDFAVPLYRRRHIDESFQFYLSIGQAF
jgi:translocation and assembly module TamA